MTRTFLLTWSLDFHGWPWSSTLLKVGALSPTLTSFLSAANKHRAATMIPTLPIIRMVFLLGKELCVRMTLFMTSIVPNPNGKGDYFNSALSVGRPFQADVPYPSGLSPGGSRRPGNADLQNGALELLQQ